MQIDFVVPKGNEEALYKTALSQNKIPVFVYNSLNFKDLALVLKRLATFEKNSYKTAYLFAPDNPAKLVLDKSIRKAVDFIIGTSQDLKTVRALVEKGRVNYIINIETTGGRDHTHYRRSNFNQVIARFCRENKVTYLIDFSRIKKVENLKRALLLGRIMQNARICRKEKAQFNAVSFASEPLNIINNDCLSALERLL